MKQPVALLLASLPLFGQSVWQDPSPHTARFVTVEPGVRLEVLDWGGPGKLLVLLTGSGNTAHVYDEFPAEFAGCCHVFAITRRGFGHSSHPESATIISGWPRTCFTCWIRSKSASRFSPATPWRARG